MHKTNISFHRAKREIADEGADRLVPAGKVKQTRLLYLSVTVPIAWPTPRETPARVLQHSCCTRPDRQTDSPLPASSAGTSRPSRSRLHALPETHHTAAPSASGTLVHSPARSSDIRHSQPAC